MLLRKLQKSQLRCQPDNRPLTNQPRLKSQLRLKNQLPTMLQPVETSHRMLETCLN